MIITANYFTGKFPKNDTYRGVSSFEAFLKPDMENIIILATTQTPIVSSAFSILHTLARRYDIKVMGYPDLWNIETIDLRYYYDLTLHIPSETYIDYSNPAVSAFQYSFRKRFSTEPMTESFAWRGFDIAFFFIGGIASHGRAFLHDPALFDPDLLCLKPDFRRNSMNSGFENRGIFMLHYKSDMTVEVIKPLSAGNYHTLD
jgi:hypothetical protein